MASVPRPHPLPAGSLPWISERELQVLAGICDGATNDGIARVLGIGRETVKGYVRSLLARTGSRNRAHLAAWALRNGLVA